MSQERLRKELWPGSAATVVPSQNHAQSRYRDKRERSNTVEEEREKDEKDNDEISFSSAGPVVALGLTRLRLVEKETQGEGKK